MCTMNLILILISQFLIIIAAFNNDHFELTCASEEDCSSYSNRVTVSKCEDHTCICRNKHGNEIKNCVPKTSEVDNFLGAGCICQDMNTENGLESACICTNVKLGEKCMMDSQCSEFSNCINETCSCPPHLMQFNDSCLSLLKDKKCTIDSDCTEHAACFKGTCGCKAPLVASTNGSVCLKVSKFGMDCLMNEALQCISLGKGGECGSNGICQCKSNYRQATKHGKTVCQRIMAPGDKCTNHMECNELLDRPAMECVKNTCRCRFGFKSETENICIPSSSATNVPQTFFSIVILLALVLPNFL